MEYVDVANLSDLPADRGYLVSVDDSPIALFLVEGQVYAVDDRCPHAGASLATGELCDGEVVCPRHGAMFDVRSGEAVGPPAEEDIRSWPVRVIDGRIEIGTG
jgi:3-phenylpropionate/trans-cinnamate dioxygenase ferredoxin subunit